MRRSARGKNITSGDAEEKDAAPVEPASSVDKDESVLVKHGQQEPQKTEAKSATAEPRPGTQTPKGSLEEERSRADIKGKKNKASMLSQPH